MTTILFKAGSTGFWIASLCAALLAGGCDSLQDKPASPGASTAVPAPPASAPPPVQPYDKAVLSAATALFKNAKLPPEGTPAQPRYTVVIDPLIDGMTGDLFPCLRPRLKLDSPEA